MPVYSRTAFAIFLAAEGDTFPYCDLFKTRNRCYSEWLMLKANTPPAVMFQSTTHTHNYFPIPSNSVDEDTYELLVTSFQAMPLPPVFSHVMDCMFGWGRSIDENWYNRILENMEGYFRNPEWARELTREQFFRQCIMAKVLPMINQLDHRDHALVMDSWITQFAYKYTDSACFYNMAVDMIQFVRGMRDQLEFDNRYEAAVMADLLDDSERAVMADPLEDIES